MEDNTVDAPPTVAGPEHTVTVIDGVEVAAFSTVVARLSADYPGVTVTRIENILVREWEAYTAGRPLVVPLPVEEGVREILDQT